MKLSYKLVLTLSAAVCVLTIVYYSTRNEQTSSPQTADAQQAKPDKPARKTLRSDSPDSGSLASVSAKTHTQRGPDQAGESRASALRARVQAAMADTTSVKPEDSDEPAEAANLTTPRSGPVTGIALVRTDPAASLTAEPATEHPSEADDTAARAKPHVPWPDPTTSQTAAPTPKLNPPPATADARAAQAYTVQPGDTFSSIAIKQYHDELRWLDIAQANPLADPTRLKVGQVLRVPDERTLHTPHEPIPKAPDGVKTYKIRPGDSLSTVAETFYDDPTLWRTIYNFNRDKIGPNPNAIQAGMTLKVPPRVRGAQ